MKLIRSKKSRYDKQATTVREKGAQASPWKVLVADDEPDVHAVTQLSLRDFRFAGKGLHFLQAASAREAREILSAEPGIAVALIDVVMETDDAGLKLVEFIREKLRNSFIRLIIRTGQPGVAPERYVIDHYDIDDYKDKTELTAQKLYAAMRSALKAFRDLSTINANRIGLEKILNATPGLYRPQSTPRFFEEMLTQVTGLCALSQENTSAINALLVTVSDGKKPAIRAATGKFAGLSLPEHAEVEKLLQACAARMPENKEPVEIPSKFTLVPLVVRD
ncbi:MAG: DUF3369 domain-containing protein, partial [Gammaproteobacteria bacterium]|nr:DUF3369 domain-containing protein [Gammaproteobacteria bacterium]